MVYLEHGMWEVLDVLIVKSGTDQEGLFPDYSTELRDFLAPHVGGPA